MKFLISFLLILTITLQTKASYMDNLVFEDSQQKPNDSTGLKNCDEHVCSRIYRPLCISVDGIQTTLASRCHLAKLRCEAMKYNLKNTKAPRSIIRVVHTGGCYEKPKRRPNSKWLRIPEDGKLSKFGLIKVLSVWEGGSLSKEAILKYIGVYLRDLILFNV
ncbi:hypothetical protein FF38_02075 [Lucilia cuprina]|uniref:Kazal-like domain-containing protein n=1 Tax=Lucilia cuprina TaxID=7375 RepID=A0A0L0BTB2_LUCCU|nr:hypothetical protein FF38_02075 [Lucilia cuprina]